MNRVEVTAARLRRITQTIWIAPPALHESSGGACSVSLAPPKRGERTAGREANGRVRALGAVGVKPGEARSFCARSPLRAESPHPVEG